MQKLDNMDNSKMDGSVISEGSVSEASLDIAREEREKLLKVLSGSLDNLPPLGSKIVRIFTSSTFTGNYLIMSYHYIG